MPCIFGSNGEIDLLNLFVLVQINDMTVVLSPQGFQSWFRFRQRLESFSVSKTFEPTTHKELHKRQHSTFSQNAEIKSDFHSTFAKFNMVVVCSGLHQRQTSCTQQKLLSASFGPQPKMQQSQRQTSVFQVEELSSSL